LGVGGILEHADDGRKRRRPPADVAVTVAPRQGQPARLQGAHHRHRRAHLEEGGEHQGDADLDLLVGVLGDHARGISHQTDR
jgi:hypothetical protein